MWDDKTEMIQEQLQIKLSEAVATSELSRWLRLVKMPSKILRPLLLARMKQISGAKAETFFGTSMNVILPEPVSVKIWRYGYFEKDVTAFILQFLSEGDTFIDIGSHFGFYSLLGAHLVGSTGMTISCEPMPRTREMLIKNMEAHVAAGYSSIVPKALGRRPETVEFKDFGILGSAFATSMDPRSSAMTDHSTVKVEVDTLDNVLEGKEIRQNMLIKIDAEGAEEAVLEGARKTIMKYRPSLILELGDSTESDKEKKRSRILIETLETEFGYHTLEFDNWSMKPHEKRDTYRYDNLFFSPLPLE